MAVPKKKKSKMKSRSHRAGAWKLAAPAGAPARVLRQREDPAHGLPVVRLVQEPRRHRRQLRSRHRLNMLPIAVDAMGGDHAPGAIVAGAKAAAAEGTPIVLVGPADPGDRVDIGDLPLIVGGRGHRDGRGRRPCRPTQEGLHARARRRGGARRPGVGDDLGRQHRRHDGLGAAADGAHQGRQPAGDRHHHPGAGHGTDRAARRRRQRRGAARLAGAVRADGLDLLARTASASTRRRSACCRSARSRARATPSARRRTTCSRRPPPWWVPT